MASMIELDSGEIINLDLLCHIPRLTHIAGKRNCRMANGTTMPIAISDDDIGRIVLNHRNNRRSSKLKEARERNELEAKETLKREEVDLDASNKQTVEAAD